MRRHIYSVLVVFVMTLAPGTAQATMHRATGEVNVGYVHMTQHVSYADQSGKLRFGGTAEGLTDEYEPMYFVQRPVYDSQLGRKVWRNIAGTGGVDAFRQPTECRYSVKLQLAAKVAKRIRRLKAHGPVRILVEIDTYNLYTRHWAIAQNLILAL